MEIKGINMTVNMLVRLIGITVVFGIIFQFAPEWARGAVIGFIFGVLLTMAEDHNHKLEKRKKRLEELEVNV